MTSLLRLAKHEFHQAYLRWQMRRAHFHSGLGDGGWLLHGLVRSAKPQTCVEIGSAHGHSACLIGLALKLNLQGRLWAVDPHLKTAWNDDAAQDTYTSIRRNLKLAGVESYVEIVRKFSRDAAADLPASIDFAFIDGDHSYEGVKADWELIRPRLSEFGVAVFHDTMWNRNADQPLYRQYRNPAMGVPRLLEELRQQRYPLITINQDWGLTLVQGTVGGCRLTLPESPKAD